MPEGDTIARAARRLDDALTGRIVEGVSGSHRAVREFGRRLVGHSVEAVETKGKHLLIHFDRRWTLRTHMGMPGVWHVYKAGDAWAKTEGKARVVLHTADDVAVCFSAPTVEIGPTSNVLASIKHLGPDLLDDQVDWDEIVRRAEESDAETAADLLLDQRIMAGIGNVVKNETLFMAGVAPHRPTADLGSEEIIELAQTGQRILRAAIRQGERITTGNPRRGQQRWVYGRAGQPCRRCGSLIESSIHGDLDRSSYWCPSCQL